MLLFLHPSPVVNRCLMLLPPATIKSSKRPRSTLWESSENHQDSGLSAAKRTSNSHFHGTGTLCDLRSCHRLSHSRCLGVLPWRPHALMRAGQTCAEAVYKRKKEIKARDLGNVARKKRWENINNLVLSEQPPLRLFTCSRSCLALKYVELRDGTKQKCLTNYFRVSPGRQSFSPSAEIWAAVIR